MQRLSFVADYQFFGFGQPGGWHFTSILIHAGAAVALFFVAEKLLALAVATRLSEAVRRWWALGIALLWAIHPLHTSAVTYVAGRADPLAALFGFAGLALGLASLEAQGRRVWLWRLGAAAGFGLALLSKESGVVWPLIWLLILVWRRQKWSAMLSWIALLAVVIGGYCCLRFTAFKTPPPPPPPAPLAVRPLLAARAFAEYAGLLVAPISLHMERDVSTKPQATFEAAMGNARFREAQTLAGVLLLLGFALWARHCFRRAPVAALCLTAFIIAYVPISNAFPLNATIAEHWLYVPSAFLFLAVLLTLLSSSAPLRLRTSMSLRAGLIGVGVAWVLFLGARTFVRQEDWRDQRAFIERTIAAGGDSARMLMNLGNVEFNAGQQQRAIALYREALQRAPEQPIIWFGFAHVLVGTRDLPGARQALERAETSPLLAAECVILRATLDQLERGTDPREGLRTAVQLAPANWHVRRRYVEALAESGDLAGAQRELLTFLETQSFRAESWNLLGRLLEKKGEVAEARLAFGEAVARDVRDQESLASLQRPSAVK
jgi:cytochrome c-type biogenesis protein CcmH/NrfG